MQSVDTGASEGVDTRELKTATMQSAMQSIETDASKGVDTQEIKTAPMQSVDTDATEGVDTRELKTVRCTRRCNQSVQMPVNASTRGS